MERRAPALLFVLLLSPALALAANPVVRVTTPLGAFDIELCAEVSDVCEAAVPNSVDNFLGYVDRGDYEGSIIHRSTTLSTAGVVVIQGGGFRREGPAIIREVPPQPAIANEFHQSNRRGTIAYARTGEVDSARSQWFVNVSDSNTILDTSNGGFTVFGVVIGDGMQVVDAIHAERTLPMYFPGTPPFFFDGSIIAFLIPLFDPRFSAEALGPIASFTDVPVLQPVVDEIFEFLTNLDIPEPPALTDVAAALIGTEITRLPEPAAGLGGATALIALAGLAQRARPA